jgi:hypothetical protein
VTRNRRMKKAAKLSVVTMMAGGALLAVSAAPAFAGGSSFTQGDLVVYETVGTTNAASAVNLVDYSLSPPASSTSAPSSATPGFTVNLPTADGSPSSGDHALVGSGGALNDGELTDSADGQSLIAEGYDDPLATAGTGAVYSSSVARTVGIVSPSGTVDTSTTFSGSGAGKTRSATTAVTGGNIYTGTQDNGLGITTDGASTNTTVNSDDVDELQVVDGNLYDSTNKTINQVGTGLPTTTASDTALVTGANEPTGFGPDQFVLTNLNGGSTPNTLYVADGSNGASSGDPDSVDKYSLESGVWTATGKITVPFAVGIAVNVVSANDVNIYVTGTAPTDSPPTSSDLTTYLYGFTDTSGLDGTLNGTPTVIAQAPSGDVFKGLAWAPVAPGTGTPEASMALAFPALGVVLLGGGYVVWRRRETSNASVASPG